MLIIAGILFSVAALLLFIDKMTDVKANLDLRWPVRILLFVAVALIIFNFYRKQPPQTKGFEKPLAVEIAVSKE